MPHSKPIWFTELGCPAVDKGANQPNVFFDPKSSESALPYYSNGERDDLIQRRFLEAHLNFWSDPANNPASTVYSGRMVDTEYLCLVLGCAAVSVFSGARRCLGRCRELRLRAIG